MILADTGIEGAHTALTERDDLTDEFRELDRELYTHDDPAEAYVVGLLLDSIRRTTEYGGTSRASLSSRSYATASASSSGGQPDPTETQTKVEALPDRNIPKRLS